MVAAETVMEEQVVYARPESLRDVPTHYCPGCTHGIAHRLVAEVLDELGVRERTIGVSPVGCAVFAYKYFNTDGCEAAHGRAPAMATGLKRVNPGAVVFTYQGDGDLAAIGMAETIHTANRGENISVIFINNTVYGMTGGQMAPTTLVGQNTPTCPNGRKPATMGDPIRVCEIINTLERPYYIERVALDSVQGILRTKKALLTAFRAQIENRGYSFVEILSPCPTYFHLSPNDSLQFVKKELSRHFPVRVFRKDGARIND